MKKILLEARDDKPLSFMNIGVFIDGKQYSYVSRFEIVGDAKLRKLHIKIDYIPENEKGEAIVKDGTFVSKTLEQSL